MRTAPRWSCRSLDLPLRSLSRSFPLQGFGFPEAMASEAPSNLSRVFSSSVWRVAVQESLLSRLGVWVLGSTAFHLSFGSAVGLRWWRVLGLGEWSFSFSRCGLWWQRVWVCPIRVRILVSLVRAGDDCPSKLVCARWCGPPVAVSFSM